ncbi:MAG: LysE family translocator [Deltaproteobacteria bacterium]|nr:LysE family translocator [Deltaproteobacteria bacterium]
MIPAAELWLYFTVVLGVVALPGLDMACAVGSSLAGGRGAGLAAVAGIVAGGFCHVVVAGTGLGVVVRLFPAAYHLLLLAGSAYMAWVGVALLRSGGGGGALRADAPGSGAAAFRRGATTNLTNPKAYLFMLAVFPQFVRPERGSVLSQAAVLWLVTAATQAAAYGCLVLAADRARRWLAPSQAAGAAVGRTVGAVLVASAAWVGWEGWAR